tara:strand:- start:1613 stop:2251 length:639 start_codon:yes stop_codon:yes gene_type:complete
MIIIVDNFYPNPKVVRENALKQFFYPGNKGKKNLFPGKRTQRTNIENWLYLKNRYEQILNRKIIDFPTNNSNTAFTLGLEETNLKGQPHLNWVHHDNSQITEIKERESGGKSWASVCYLSPDAKPDHGTGLFRAKNTKSVFKTKEMKIAPQSGFKEFWKPDGIFDMHTYVANIYNRLILYPANYWHAPFNAGWGHDKESGRLVQVCFFTTEK